MKITPQQKLDSLRIAADMVIAAINANKAPREMSIKVKSPAMDYLALLDEFHLHILKKITSGESETD